MDEIEKRYDVVRYNNGLNTVPLRKFTPVEMDIFWSVLSKMKRKGTQTIEFDFDVFKELSKYNRSNRRHKDRFYNDLKSMADKMVSLNYKFEDERYYEQFVLFQRFSIDKDEEKVILQASERFGFVLNDIELGFTRFELDNVTTIDSGYVKELYRQLMQYKNRETKQGYWAVKIDEFKRLLSVPESYRMYDIDRRILTKAKKEFLEKNEDGKSILNSFSVEKIKAKKGNAIDRLVIRFEEYSPPNSVPDINWLDDFKNEEGIK